MVVAMALAGALGLASTSSVKASDVPAGGYVVNPMPMRNGVVIFTVVGTRTTPLPTCATSGGWAINASTVAGQAQLAVLLSAHAQHKKIIVIGMGNCADWPDTESVNYFRIDETS